MATAREKDVKGDNGFGRVPHAEYEEAYRVWGDLYQRMAEESMGMFQKGLDAAQAMVPGYGTDAFRMWSNTTQDMISNLSQELYANPGNPAAAYRKFYETWLETMSHGMDRYMRTPEFVEQSGKNLEAMSDLQQKMSEALEAYWHFMRLPSSQDMRELYQKLYLLDRKFDDMDRRIRAIHDAVVAGAGNPQATQPAKSPSAKSPSAKAQPKRKED